VRVCLLLLLLLWQQKKYVIAKINIVFFAAVYKRTPQILTGQTSKLLEKRSSPQLLFKVADSAA
jgi:hypothetical protein